MNWQPETGIQFYAVNGMNRYPETGIQFNAATGKYFFWHKSAGTGTATWYTNERLAKMITWVTANRRTTGTSGIPRQSQSR